MLDNVVFIDWLSPVNHKTFNQSLFECLNIEMAHYYTFDERLKIKNQINSVQKSGKSRVSRAIENIKLIFKNRKRKIILITYDPIFVIFARLITKNIFVIEHNTTPEPPRFLKHAIWQLLFLRGLKRLALFREQEEVLSTLRQRCTYIGSPIPVRTILPRNESENGNYYLSPSYRHDLSELNSLGDVFADTMLVVKASSNETDQLSVGIREVEIREFIDLERDRNRIKSIIISGSMGVRLSGWVNEGLGYNIPIIATNVNTEKAIEKNFPDFSFIKGSEIRSGADVDELIRSIRQEKHIAKITNNNQNVRRRFVSAVGM